MKRIAFFILTNLLVSIVLFAVASFVMYQLQIEPGSYAGIFVFCFIFGMGSAFISLQMSKWSAKKLMRLEPVAKGSGLAQKVNQFARRSGLEKMPEVYIYQSPELNAFATGPSRSNSLVAVSTGLLNSMHEDELDGVLAHEVSHIANGDMVTMTLVQGMVNTLAMFLSYVITQIIVNILRGDDDDDGHYRGGVSSMANYFIRQLVYGLLSFLSLPLIMYISRWREYRADAGSARVAGKEKMIAALKKLQEHKGIQEKHDRSLEVMSINSRPSFTELFSSHPPLSKRIQALEHLNLALHP